MKGSFVFVAGPGAGIRKEDALTWTVTNIGREPVVLTYMGGKLADKNYFVVLTHQRLPQLLQPGAYFTDYMDGCSNAGV